MFQYDEITLFLRSGLSRSRTAFVQYVRVLVCLPVSGLRAAKEQVYVCD